MPPRRCVPSTRRWRSAPPAEQLRLWSLLGRTVVAGAAQLPALAGTSRTVAARRGQVLLDAFLTLGVPVRGLAKLGKAYL